MSKIPAFIKAVIFDVDGLLIESEPYWYQTTEAFFEKYNKPFHEDIHKQIRGKSLHDIMEYFKKEYGFVGDTKELIVERKAMLYEVLLDNVALMEGSQVLLHDLHKKGIPMAIATAAHKRDMIEKMLEETGVQSMFSVVLCGEDVAKNKPAPDIYLLAAKQLHVAPKACLVLEDSATGVLAGKSAGMTVYGINGEREFHKGLEEAGADKIFTSLAQIHI
ncbi:MAG TPA: HAD family phosphatase [Patescibacteria group bacterium]|nr:HAD family phosphatase [Patescibacteria group bacterium]